MSVRVAPSLLHGKVVRALPVAEHVVRERLSRRLDGGARVTLVAAMPGYGKSIAVAHWADTATVPVAWLSLDLLDGDARSFWSHLLLSVAAALPDLDVESQMLLDERGVDDPLFLTALVAGIHALGSPVALVLDGLDRRVEGAVHAGLALLVERTDGLVRVVITARSTPSLPLARWRARGWLDEIRQDELRLTDEEAIAIADRIDPRSAANAATLNRRVDGWLIAFHMALLSGAGAIPDRSTLDALADDSSRGLASSLVAEVLESMSDHEQDTVLALSVFDSFDPGICAEVVGPDAAGVVRDLLRRGMFLTIVDAATGRMRFHALFRELLEAELAWRDPAARIELHRRAANVWQARGDLLSAYHHLSAIGERETASDVLLGPVMAMVDRGDLAALHRVARQLPAPQDVTSPMLALDLATIASHAQGTAEAHRWAVQARHLIEKEPVADGEAELRLLALACWIDLLGADLDGAVSRLNNHRPDGEIGGDRRAFTRLPIVATRVMLAARRRDDARWWLEQAELSEGPEILAAVTVPSLRAWYEWIYGRLDHATALIDPALSWIDQRGIRAHHLAFDTLITAGWCRLSAGDLPAALELAARVAADAEVFDSHWTRLQAGFLGARCALTSGRPLDAIQLIDDLASTIDFATCHGYADRLLGVEVEAMAVAGRMPDALRLLRRMEPGPRVRLLRARFGLLSASGVLSELADRAEWPVIERVQADAIVLAHRTDAEVGPALRALLAECAESGWVLPLLGAGVAVDRLLRTVSLDELHPALARAIAAVAPTTAPPRQGPGAVVLTERERTLLELLPTHLSYADIGGQLYLSVNTVKTNLKTLYRKLGAATRAEAVDAGRRLGLL